MHNTLTWHLVMHMVMMSVPVLGNGGMGWHGAYVPAHDACAVINRSWQIEHLKRKKQHNK